MPEVSLLARIFSELKMEIFANFDYKNLNDIIYNFGTIHIQNIFNVDDIFDSSPFNQTFEKLKSKPIRENKRGRKIKSQIKQRALASGRAWVWGNKIMSESK